MLASLAAGLGAIPIAALVISRGGQTAPWSSYMVFLVLVWTTSTYTVLTSFVLRARSYGAVARRNFLQQTATAGGQILAARWLPTGFGLLLGLALGRCVGIASLLRESGLFRKGAATSTSIVTALRRYWRFPLVFTPSALLNVVATQIPVLLVASRFGAADAGNLAQAVRLGAIPAALIGGAVSSVVMAEIAHRVRDGQLDNRARYLRVSRALVPLAVAWFLLLVVVAPFVLPVILGGAWDSAGDYAAAMSLGVAGGLIASPLSVVFALYERARLNVTLDISRLLLMGTLGLMTTIMDYGPVTVVLAMSTGMFAVYAATWTLGLKIVTPHVDDSTWDADERGRS